MYYYRKRIRYKPHYFVRKKIVAADLNAYVLIDVHRVTSSSHQ